MESCRGVVVASAILNDHDKVRQPKGLGSATLKTACFFMFVDDRTHGVLTSHGILKPDDPLAPSSTVVGAWRVVKLQQEKLPYESPAMNGVVVKHLLHRLFPNARFSVWVDGKMQLTVDPLLLVHSLLLLGKQGADMAVSKHPFNLHTMEEAIATARWHKWGDADAIRAQMETYCRNGLSPWSPSKLPYPSGMHLRIDRERDRIASSACVSRSILIRLSFALAVSQMCRTRRSSSGGTARPATTSPACCSTS